MAKSFSYLLSSVIILLTLAACNNNSESSKKTEVVTAADAITIINPRIRALPPGQKVTAMYMQLKNDSETNHDLVKVEGTVSNMIELHTHTMNDGVMQMGQVESIPVAANSTAEAKPGSYHVMIMGLQKDLVLGEKMDFTLSFKDGSSKSITAEVKTLKLD